nr:hypothetical protein [Tanacetum cinerariifolium]
MKKTNLGTVVKTKEGEILEDDADDPMVDVPSLYKKTTNLWNDMKSRVVIDNVSNDVLESRSVERRGQSSFAGHNAANTKSVTCVMLMPSCSSSGKRRSESQRVLPSSTRSQRTSNRNVRRRSVRPISNEIHESSSARAGNTQFSTHDEVCGNESSSYRDLDELRKDCRERGVLGLRSVKGMHHQNFELPTILEPRKLAKVDKDAILVDVVRELAVDP